MTPARNYAALDRAADMDGRAGAGMERITRAGMALRPELRAMRLRQLLSVSADEIADESPEGRAEIIRRLQNAIQAEERRSAQGVGGFVTYDMNRHIALKQMLAAEQWRARAEMGRMP